MISIIICSADQGMLAEVSANIDKTIGVPYEIISFDNSKAEHSICNIYNKGARAARFEKLCFMHEDINIHTQDWGKVVAEAFDKQPKLGILGVIGSAYKAAAPTGWYTISPENNILHGNYIQGFKYEKKPSHLFFENPLNTPFSKVVSVDGMWFCSTKTIAEQYPFDEDLLTGFHCYDLDFCYQVGQEYDVMVTFNILMEHYSEGHFAKEWWLDTIKLHRKWIKKLPMSTQELSPKDKFLVEKRMYRWLIESLQGIGYSRSYVLSFLMKQKLRAEIGWQQYFKANIYAAKYFSRQKKH